MKAREHQWQGISSSGSGDWECVYCRQYVNGGIHDGGPYYPGRGQIVPPCMPSSDAPCWCSHIFGRHKDGGKCLDCPPRIDGGHEVRSYEDAERINAKCIQEGRAPYAFYEESWCMEFEHKEIADRRRKECEDEREQRGIDALVTGDERFESWWKESGRPLAKRITAKIWFDSEMIRANIKHIAFEAWLAYKRDHLQSAITYSGPMRNRWGRIPTPQDRYCCAGCDHFISLNGKGEHWFVYPPYGEDGKWRVLGPCKAKETYNPNDPSVMER